jgi:hypothetical protein
MTGRQGQGGRASIVSDRRLAAGMSSERDLSVLAREAKPGLWSSTLRGRSPPRGAHSRIVCLAGPAARRKINHSLALGAPPPSISAD